MTTPVQKGGGITAAAIDIGTNSVKLTIARLAADDTLDTLADTTRVTRLGKSVDSAGQLDSGAVSRTLDALREFAGLIKQHEATRVAGVGTSALRDAGQSGDDFVRQATEILGGPVEVISGDREADLIYTAARRDPLLTRLAREAGADATRTAVSDIGGGSTEVVLGEGGQVTFAQSLQLGAVRLTERANFSDPPTPEELTQAHLLARQALEAVPPPDGTVFAVGSGGTIANLASLHRCQQQPSSLQDIAADPAGVLHGTVLTGSDIMAQIARLANVPLAERRKLPGLEPDRADVIIAGAIVQAEVLARLGTEQVVTSTRGLRFGLLYDLLYKP